MASVTPDLGPTVTFPAGERHRPSAGDAECDARKEPKIASVNKCAKLYQFFKV